MTLHLFAQLSRFSSPPEVFKQYLDHHAFCFQMWLLWSRSQISVDVHLWICAGGFVSTRPEAHLGWLPAFPWLRLGQGQCHQQYFVRPHKGWQVTPQTTLPGGQHLQRNTKWLLSQQECSSPAYLPPKLGNGYGGFYSNNWGADHAPTGLWQPQSKEETLLNVKCRLLSPQPQSHPLSGRSAQHTLRKDMEASI